ncbi:MAG TPA: DUF6599 family protein [Bryobacteraceae bacterium]|nr:DUF6599 family protein [Bryobacteraceae bacterium]
MKLALVVLFPVLAGAATWPDMLGDYHRTSDSPAHLTDQPLWDELGLRDSETAVYENGKAKFTATVYRLVDTTASLAAFDWRRPKDAKPSKLANLAAETRDGLVLVRGNYLVETSGYKPSADEINPVLDTLLDVDGTPLPTLPSFLPSDGLVPNSERYITGPVALQKFVPGIPPSVAAFHMGAEAQAGVFHSPKGDLTLAIFSYPTNQIALQKATEFQKLPGAVVKRAGPLLAVTLFPPDPDAAERVLAQVRYFAQVTLHEATPTTAGQVGNMLVNIFVLIGILLVFSIVAGMFVGGFRAFFLRGRKGQTDDPMILLHLEER